MPHPDHDALVDAFRRAAAVGFCSRAGEPGYTHVHGPLNPHHAASCRNHVAIIERFSGTVSVRGNEKLRKPDGTLVGGTKRPDVSIRQHPLGHSAGKHSEAFRYGFTADDIRRFWKSFDAFARAVVRACPDAWPG
jgi:hypothetical protein